MSLADSQKIRRPQNIQTPMNPADSTAVDKYDLELGDINRITLILTLSRLVQDCPSIFSLRVDIRLGL